MIEIILPQDRFGKWAKEETISNVTVKKLKESGHHKQYVLTRRWYLRYALPFTQARGALSFVINLNGAVKSALLYIELDRFFKKATCQIYRQNFLQIQNIVTNDKKPFCKVLNHSLVFLGSILKKSAGCYIL